MNNKSIEGYLKKMIAIDREALEIEARVEQENEKRQKELRKIKRETEMEVMRKARMEARKETEGHIKETKEYEKLILAQTEEEIQKLKAVYDASEKELVREIMKNIFDGVMPEA